MPAIADDDDDLIGAVPPARRGRGRPTNEERLEKVRAQAEASPGGKIQVGSVRDFVRPVTRAFLAQIFQMEPRTVVKRLAPLDPVGFENGNAARPLYRFLDAVEYLVKPKHSLAEYIQTVRVQDLPAHLAPGIQQALLTRQTLETRARKLWREEDVMNVFGDVFMLIKNQMQLWTETLRDNCPDLTDDHLDRIGQLTDELQGEIHAQLIALPKRQRTPSSLEHIDARPAGYVEPEDELDDEMIG